MIEEAITIATEALIKPFEGYHRRLPDGSCAAYADPGTGAKPWTIGWGCTGPDINEDTIWTRQQAEERLEAEVLHFANGVLKLSPSLSNEPPKRLAAIISFAFNCGLGAYRISTLKKRVDAKDWHEAQKEIVRWNKAAGRVLKGLTIRRQAEAKMLENV